MCMSPAQARVYDDRKLAEMQKMKCAMKLSLILFSICCCVLVKTAENAAVEVNVGVVIDLDLPLGKMGLSCINISLSDFYTAHPHYNTRLKLNVRDSKKSVAAAASAAEIYKNAASDLIKNSRVQAIIGPISSMQTSIVIYLGKESHVPILSFAATSPALASLGSSYFFQIAENDAAQVGAVTAIVQAFGWKEAIPIYVDNEYGKGVIPFLTNALQQVDIKVPYLSVIPPPATDLQVSNELYKLMTMQTRVFIVHMSKNPGSRLFTVAKQIGMMSEGYVWIITNGVANLLDNLNSSVKDAMQGVLGVKTYVPKTAGLEDFEVRWKRRFLMENPTLDTNLIFPGLWAYDAATALAMAVEKVGPGPNPSFSPQITNNASGNLPDFDTIGVSENGEKLRDALSSVRFRGLAGDFAIANRQSQEAVYQIVTVNGNGERGIGFWTPRSGLAKNLNLLNGTTYSTSKNNLKPILWPGDSYSVPKGWQIPANGKKYLRIGVPVNNVFPEFVRIVHDSDTNTTKIDGYCIDVFAAAVALLPYALSYELIPFAKANGESAGTYNDLIYEVFNGNFDAVVGDTTITANRSNYVDFTLPYTESGVSMFVPIKDTRNKSAWVFLKPLTRDLWLMIASSFVFIGFVVWVLEHRINKDFGRGPPVYQIGTCCWFSISTMVFAHRERVVSNLARFVVIIWVFVVLILTQSYTASLTSLLTVEQLRPTVTEVYELKKNRLNVGYQEGSFVRGLLKDLGFEDSQLKVFSSIEQCDELFTLGSANGGIAAAFDEIPGIRIILGKYCSKYSRVEPTYKTDGFGFVFPRDSPLVADVSRAILRITEDPIMKKIENAWFHNRSSCPDPSTTLSSNSLGLESFWGLFLVVGVASIFALIISAISFLYQQRHVWRQNSNTSIWRRIGVLLRNFYKKDINSRPSKKSDDVSKSESSSPYHDRSGAVEAPPAAASPTNQTESNFVFNGDRGFPLDNNVNIIIEGQPPNDGDAIIELTAPSAGLNNSNN